MKKLMVTILILSSSLAFGGDFEDIQDLAQANGFKTTPKIINAILDAADQFNLEPTDLAAIAIVETGMGTMNKVRKNTNGTEDVGLFQINTINHPKCIPYDLHTNEGSSMCAAKLLFEIKKKRDDYIGVYHSKSPKHKALYMRKIATVLSK